MQGMTAKGDVSEIGTWDSITLKAKKCEWIWYFKNNNNNLVV